jgi:hypothetical protein
VAKNFCAISRLGVSCSQKQSTKQSTKQSNQTTECCAKAKAPTILSSSASVPAAAVPQSSVDVALAKTTPLRTATKALESQAFLATLLIVTFPTATRRRTRKRTARGVFQEVALHLSANRSTAWFANE